MNETGIATWVQPKQTFEVVGKNEVSGRRNKQADNFSGRPTKIDVGRKGN
jgi:hypothetical protein